MAIVLSDHAAEQAARRGIPHTDVPSVARTPEQVLTVRPDREIRQSRALLEGRIYVVRVVVDRGSSDDTIVTVYRTSQVEKYWRTS